VVNINLAERPDPHGGAFLWNLGRANHNAILRITIFSSNLATAARKELGRTCFAPEAGLFRDDNNGPRLPARYGSVCRCFNGST
jgi:hypothetical protein